MPPVVFQDYRDASSVLVQGQATLKLKTMKRTVTMKSSPSLVTPCCSPPSLTACCRLPESLLPVCRLRSTFTQSLSCSWTLAPPCGSSWCRSWLELCCWLWSAFCFGRFVKPDAGFQDPPHETFSASHPHGVVHPVGKLLCCPLLFSVASSREPAPGRCTRPRPKGPAWRANHLTWTSWPRSSEAGQAAAGEACCKDHWPAAYWLH